jgi:hypothetical protein
MSSMTSWLSALGQGNGLILAGLVLLVLAIIALVATLGAWISGDRLGKHSARRRRLSPVGGLIRLLGCLVLFFFALSLLLAGAALRTYTVFTRQDKIGTLECLDRDADNQRLIVRFTPLRGGSPERSQTYTLSGDQWEVSAHILRWTPKTIQLGIPTAYRLNMLKGVYQHAEDESRLPHQAWALSAGSDWLWSLLDRYGQHLPMVAAVYGNAVSNLTAAGDIFDIYVTTSGLSAQRR